MRGEPEAIVELKRRAEARLRAQEIPKLAVVARQVVVEDRALLEDGLARQ